MKKILCYLGILVGLLFWPFTFVQSSNYCIHIKLQDTTALQSVLAVDTSLVVERVFRYSPKFESKHQKAGLHLWYMVNVKDSARTAGLLKSYKALSGVDIVEEVTDSNFMNYKVEPVSDAVFRSVGELPVNDPLYIKQWDLKNRVFAHAVDINIEKAWCEEMGSEEVIVAVMDQLFDPLHEDLHANVWVNEKELNGESNVDDDGNGFVDDIYGFTARGLESLLGDHGTHVAGTIAAVNNNGVGVCGIAGGNGVKGGVKIMRCQVVPNVSNGQKAEAYVYAADHGAVISQNSWVNEDGYYASAVIEGIKYFMEYAGQVENAPMKGGLVVWGAGNQNSTKRLCPDIDPVLNRDNLITVGSVSPDGDKASYSNYGDFIDVAAPGGDLNKQAILSTILDNRYGYMQGTSMACPHVSGVAALVVSKFKGNNLRPKDVKCRILSSVSDVNQFTEGQKGFNKMGSGVIDAWKALLDNQQIKPKDVENVWVSRNVSPMVEISWVIPNDEDDQAIDSCLVYYSNSPINECNSSLPHASLFTGGRMVGDTVRYRLLSPQPGSTCYFRILCKDRWGNSSGFSKEVSCEAKVDKPVIYGDYLFNRFYTYQNSALFSKQEDSLFLDYKILVPANMEVDYKLVDEGNSVEVQSFKDNQLSLLLAPKADLAPKEYEAQIVAWEKGNDQIADTLSFAYVVRPFLVSPIGEPEIRPGKSLDFKVDSMTGCLTLNLLDYFEDPRGYGLFFNYDTDQDEEYFEGFNSFNTVLKGDSLFINYVFDEYALKKGNNSVFFELKVKSYSCLERVFNLYVTYNNPTSNEKISTLGVYAFPNPVETVLNIQSPEPISAICVYSLNGYMVQQVIKPGSLVDLSRLTPGVYMVQIMTSKGNVVKKIIKR